jgi:acyl carrier protein
MEKAAIETQVKQIMDKYIKQSFTTRDDLVSLGLGSVQSVEATLQIEKTFSIRISDAEAKNLRTVDAITNFVIKKLG